jgi:hypothetical protein
MATIVFDGDTHTLTLFDAQNKQVGQWHANNVVDHRATLRFVPNGFYPLIDQTHPHRHGGDADTLNGPYGRFGILRLQDFTADDYMHRGVGIHAGRADRGGADHATRGCIRTTDAAMEAITRHIRTDPLLSLSVQNNREQHNSRPQHPGDHHQQQHHRRHTH